MRLFQDCSNFYKLARKQEDLAILQANIGNYIHFSNSERFGISFNRNVHWGNPRALYGFPFTTQDYLIITKLINKEIAESEHFHGYDNFKYIYIFTVNGNILDMDNINLPNLAKKIKNFTTLHYPASYQVNFDPSANTHHDGAEFLRWLNRIVNDYLNMGIFQNEHSALNILLRGIGYDAMKTNNFGFGDDIRAEIAVLHPNSVNLLAKIMNPILSKEDIKLIDWYSSPEYARQLKEKDDLILKEMDRKTKLLEMYNKENEIAKKLERTLLQEKKWDESLQVMKDFYYKWKDVFK